jgi:hypothetical protein
MCPLQIHPFDPRNRARRRIRKTAHWPSVAAKRYAKTSDRNVRVGSWLREMLPQGIRPLWFSAFWGFSTQTGAIGSVEPLCAI